MGMIFFLIPEWYAELEGANTENIAWLKNLGAALIAVNGVGALLASKDPIAENNCQRKNYFQRNAWKTKF